MVQNDELELRAVGDVFTDVEDGTAVFAGVEPVLSAGDIVLGNCEASTAIVLPSPPRESISWAHPSHTPGHSETRASP
ncbi:hypothetical protein DC31_04325 [Microbacterium sp. CH12i]|nr:hypothetical protein DC31_04325 [Microbacterium sp. CH12i]